MSGDTTLGQSRSTDSDVAAAGFGHFLLPVTTFSSKFLSERKGILSIVKICIPIA